MKSRCAPESRQFFLDSLLFCDLSGCPHSALKARRNYGEERYQLMGMIEQRLFVLVYTPRHDAMRIISARKANQREVKHYEDSTHED